MNQQNPFDICMAHFTPQTLAQREFCEKAERAVQLYVSKLSVFNTEVTMTVSSKRIAHLERGSCRSHGFIAWRAGELVAEHEEQGLFYGFYASSHLFTILDKCPNPLAGGDDSHWHLRDGGGEQDKGTSDTWKHFPVGMVLAGLKELLRRFEDDAVFVDANAMLDGHLLAATAVVLQ